MTARKHHYLSQCYLKGFTKQRRKPKIEVFDREGRFFSTPPANIGAERDFNRVDIAGLPIDALEQSLSMFEGELAPALERIIAARSIRNQDDYAYLLNLVGLVLMRNPRNRKFFHKFQENVMDKVMGIALSTREMWEGQIRKAKAAGVEFPEKPVDYEDIKSFFNNKQYKVEVPIMRHSDREFSVFDKILPYLFKRKWMLLKAPAGSSGFITCDHPFCLTWASDVQHSIYPPGLGLRNTEAYFPISKELAMIGTFEGEDKELQIDDTRVALCNGMIVAYSERQVYAQDKDCLYISRPGEKPRRVVELINDSNFKRIR